MKKFLIIFLTFLVLVLLVWCYSRRLPGGRGTGRHDQDSVTENWISWNLLFTPTSLGDSTKIIKDFISGLNDYVHKKNPAAVLTFHFKYCPCDSLLTNMDVTVLWGSGQIITPPPTRPNPGPKGDYTLGNNFNMSIPDYTDSIDNYIDTSKLIIYKDTLSPGPALSTRQKVLAVIDTGLDTALFRMSYPNTIWAGNMLWQESSLKSTILNVVDDGPINKLEDNTKVKHGTAATQIILTQMNFRSGARIPRIMSIRAFDDSERGSIYTVSCALSYAIQHHADFINASWGYFGQEDSVLRHYVKKASDQSIRIIAAAGNTPGVHDPDKVCSATVNTANFLDDLKKKDSLFYPACFAPDFLNLVSVTELDTVTATAGALTMVPCYYQNYSATYITLGALESRDPRLGCCKFSIPFLHMPIEGSSFATPMMTAILMNALWDKGTPIKSFIDLNANHNPINSYTEKGSYFNYFQIQ